VSADNDVIHKIRCFYSANMVKQSQRG